MLKAFDLVTQGSDYGATSTQQIDIKLSNFLALAIALALLFLMLYNGAAGGFSQISFLLPFFPAALMLLIPVLNKNGHITISRIFLCWLPSVFVTVNFWILAPQADVMEITYFVGFQTFQGASLSLPFLVFSIADKRSVGIALALPLTATFFLHFMLAQLSNSGSDPADKWAPDPNTFAGLVSLSIIVAACVFVKRLIVSEEKLNSVVRDESARKMHVMAQDVAESERKLKKVYERLSHHISHSPLPIIKRNRELCVTFINKQAENLFGWTAAEVVGRDLMFLIHPDDKGRFLGIVQTALAENAEPGCIETRCIGINGEELSCIWYHSFIRDEHGQVETILSFVSDTTGQRALTHSLGERIKELRTLYNVGQLLTGSDRKMEDVFEDLPELLPDGWQFPEICAARLVVFAKEYKTKNFKETSFRQSVVINIRETTVGTLEVLYLERGPWRSEEPFLREEQDLLTTVSSMLKDYILRKLEEDELTKARANLFATINNTDTMIWSVDQNLKLITYNESFFRYNLKTRNMPVTRGIKHYYFFDDHASKMWEERYMRALQGEAIKIEEKVLGDEFRYSLNPIVENGIITGVSVFADDITEQKFRNNQLAEANKKIIDLKMMALRSVMNPHFIFNVLSSIQYFITRNDELNAINYLTSFSKLMRTVLTRSVADLVTVTDEIALVHNYVALEKLRFEDKFLFDIECENPQRLEHIKMPSLLLQPYVENAILHGLYNKEGTGTLIIRIKEANEFLVFEIEDDGIGREAARKITERQKVHRKSMGAQLTEERLALLNGVAQNAVTYTDLFKGKKPAGTRVTLKIKITDRDDVKFHNS